MTASADTLFCACAPGLEPILAAEVRALAPRWAGLACGPAPAPRELAGGVELQGGPRALALLLLSLRSATRVLLRLGAVAATGFPELVRKAAALPFERVLRPGQPVALRVSCHQSRLYHSGAVAERLREALAARLGAASPLVKPAAEDDDGEPAAQLLLARFERDRCTVSADASGALLHRRGLRTGVSQAPLRETLAAALLLAAGYDGAEPLLDPFCGAGTIPLEAALISRGAAPGLARSFASEGWPGQPAAEWAALRARLRAGALWRARSVILGSDLDRRALAAARRNLAALARLAPAAGAPQAPRGGPGARAADGPADPPGADEVVLALRKVADIAPPSGPPGLLATNPPYGKRVGGSDPAAAWRDLGAALRARFGGWRVAALCPDRRLAAAAGLAWRPLLSTQNGGLRVELLLARA